MIPAVLAATLPSLIKLFTSDDKSEAVKDVTSVVVSKAAKALGIKNNSIGKEDILKHLESNPKDTVKLKEIEREFEVKIRELDLKELEIKESNITDRWKSDNEKGSSFAKLLRPGLTAFLVLVSVLLAIADGNIGEFTIKEHWVTLFTSLTLTAVGGYFTLRTYEKRTGTSKWTQSK